MTLIDLLPALHEQNGDVPQKSGVRLAADLQIVREEIKLLSGNIAKRMLGVDAEQVQELQGKLRNVLVTVDSIDPYNPPPQEAVELLSTRVGLVVSEFKIALLKQMLREPAGEPVAAATGGERGIRDA